MSLVHEVRFLLRRNAWGKLKLRRGLPAPLEDQRVRGEREFYRRVLLASRLEKKGISRVWDIGCRNWSYARALSEFFPEAELTGIELDGGRRYWNLHRRQDLAHAYARELRALGRKVECVFGDFRDIAPTRFNFLGRGAQSLYCFFFPFVSVDPCLSWGLPARFADFASLLAHAAALSEGEGRPLFLSTHQGEWEAELAREAYARQGIAVQEQTLRPDEFEGLWPSRHEVRIFTRIEGSGTPRPAPG